MNSTDKNANRILSIICAWGVIPVLYLAWCLFTVGYKNPVLFWGGAITGVAGIIMYVLTAQKLGEYYISLKKEMMGVNCGFAVMTFLVMLVAYKEFESEAVIAAYMMLLVAFSAFIYLIIKNYENTFTLKQTGLKYAGLIALIVMIIIFSFDGNGYFYKWDGLLYYDAVKQATLNSVSSLALYGHMALTSGAVYRLFGALCGDIAIGMLMANAAIMIGATVALYKTLMLMVPGRKAVEYTAVTAMFSFSPFLLGMMGYFSTDWFCVCTVIILIYFVFSRQWLSTIVWSCAFALSKEPALIAYGGLCLGLVISDLLDKGTVRDKFLKLICSVHYYFMLIPFFVWFGTYKILGQWNAGDGGFQIDAEYMVEKLKVFLVLNFNWVITILALAGIIYICINKCVKAQYIWPLMVSNVCLLIFNFAFKTVNHPRYIDSFVSLNLLLAGVAVLILIKDWRIVTGVAGIIAVVNLISCFITFDPVSRLIFDGVDTGNAWLITTSDCAGGDSSIYNRQMLWLEVPVSQAIADSLEENSDIVLMSDGNAVYAGDGMSKTIQLSRDWNKDTQYWNNEKKARVPYASQYIAESEQFDIYHVSSETDFSSVEFDGDVLSVICINGLNAYTMADGWELTDSKEYKYRGWTVTRDVLTRLEKDNND